MRLNLGCGKDLREGWLNVDRFRGSDLFVSPDWTAGDPLPETLWADLDQSHWADSLDANVVDESEGSHVLEHLTNPLAFMAELYRVTKPEGTVTFRLPYGSSDDAWEDPTHVRPYYLGSFAPFAQTYYWRADYGYTGDWQVTDILLAVDPAKAYIGDVPLPADLLLERIQSERNVVVEMTATLTAVKPARPQIRDDTHPRVTLALAASD